MSRPIHTQGSTSPQKQDCPFRIVAVFDSPSASSEAARASAVVVRELGDDIPFDRSSWQLDALKSASICEAAAAEASRADMIVIAVSATGEHDLLKRWVASWEGHRQVSGGLLALIPIGKGLDRAGLENYLYEAAVTADMDFVCRKAKRF